MLPAQTLGPPGLAVDEWQRDRIAPALRDLGRHGFEQRLDAPVIILEHVLLAALSLGNGTEHDAVEHAVGISAVEPVEHGFHLEQRCVGRCDLGLERVPPARFHEIGRRRPVDIGTARLSLAHQFIEIAPFLVVEQGPLQPAKVHDLRHRSIEPEQRFNRQAAPVGLCNRRGERFRHDNVIAFLGPRRCPFSPTRLPGQRLLRALTQIDLFEQGMSLVEIVLIDRLRRRPPRDLVHALAGGLDLVIRRLCLREQRIRQHLLLLEPQRLLEIPGDIGLLCIAPSLGSIAGMALDCRRTGLDRISSLPHPAARPIAGNPVRRRALARLSCKGACLGGKDFALLLVVNRRQSLALDRTVSERIAVARTHLGIGLLCDRPRTQSPLITSFPSLPMRDFRADQGFDHDLPAGETGHLGQHIGMNAAVLPDRRNAARHQVERIGAHLVPDPLRIDRIDAHHAQRLEQRARINAFGDVGLDLGALFPVLLRDALANRVHRLFEQCALGISARLIDRGGIGLELAIIQASACRILEQRFERLLLVHRRDLFVGRQEPVEHAANFRRDGSAQGLDRLVDRYQPAPERLDKALQGRRWRLAFHHVALSPARPQFMRLGRNDAIGDGVAILGKPVLDCLPVVLELLRRIRAFRVVFQVLQPHMPEFMDRRG